MTYSTDKNSNPTIPIDKLLIPNLWEDGNVFAVMGKVTSALKRAGRHSEVSPYLDAVMSGDHDNAVRVTMAIATDHD